MSDIKSDLTAPRLTDDSMKLRLGLEVDYSKYNLENGDGFGHDGLSLPIPRIEVGTEIPMGNNMFGQVNLVGSKGSGKQYVGEGLTSQFSHLGIGANGRIGVALLEKQLRIHAGLDIGLVHVSAEEGSGPQERGAAYAGEGAGKSGTDALTGLFPIDDWAVNLAGELGISYLFGKKVEVSARIRLGEMLAVDPVISFEGESGGAYEIPLSIPYLQMGLAATYHFDLGGATASPTREKSGDEEGDVSPANETDNPTLPLPGAEPTQTPDAPAAAGAGAEPAAGSAEASPNYLADANKHLKDTLRLQQITILQDDELTDLRFYASDIQENISKYASAGAENAKAAFEELKVMIKETEDKTERANFEKQLKELARKKDKAIKLANDVLKIARQIYDIYVKKTKAAKKEVDLDFTATAPAMPKPRKPQQTNAASGAATQQAPAATAVPAASAAAASPQSPAPPPAESPAREEDDDGDWNIYEDKPEPKK